MTIESKVIPRSPMLEALGDSKKFNKLIEKLERTKESADKALSELAAGRSLKKMESDTKKLVKESEAEIRKAEAKLSDINQAIADKKAEYEAMLKAQSEEQSSYAAMKKETAALNKEAKASVKAAVELKSQAEVDAQAAAEAKQTYESKLADLNKYLKAVFNG